MALRLVVDAGKPRSTEPTRAALGFRVDVECTGDTVRVCPVGEVDLATVDELREPLDEAIAAGTRRLILDLRETTFLDSTGLRLAVRTDQSAAAHGVLFGIIPGPPAVRRPFEIAGLDTTLPFVALA